MKKTILLILLLFCHSLLRAQEAYTIEGEILELKNEVDGKIDLLWNIVNQNYRYFVRTEDGTIQELVNTKGEDNKFKEEYKSVLQSLTDDTQITTEDLNLTLVDLRKFFKKYNSSIDSTKSYSSDKAKVMARLGFFGGLTNQPFIENINNTTVPFFGAELEFFEESNMPRHTGFIRIKHALEADDFKYTATQFAIGYRFKFINKSKYNIYGNAKLVTFTVFDSNLTYEDIDNPGTFLVEDKSGSNIDTPFVFGIGSDIKIAENSYITLAYNEIFALFNDSQGNFPIDFAVGYKFNL